MNKIWGVIRICYLGFVISGFSLHFSDYQYFVFMIVRGRRDPNLVLLFYPRCSTEDECCHYDQNFLLFLLNFALLLPIILHKTIINHLLRFLKDFVKFRIMITNHSLQIYNFLHLPANNLQVKLTKRKPTNLQLSHFESCRFYNGKHPKSTAYKV